jgi:phage recombination protein Bet
MNGIQNQQPPVPNFLSKEEEDLLKRTILKSFAEDEQATFIRICQRTHLDPFTKQVYATRRYQKVRDDTTGDTRKVATLVPVTGIMGLTAVADRTGHYDGCAIWWSGPDGVWKTEWLEDGYPTAAKCVVYHKQRKNPETAIARWSSYVGQTYNYQTKEWEVSDFWHKMPDYMLGKVAKAAALRGAFPSPLSNLYIREELDSNITDAEETESIPADEAKIAENQRREAELRASPLPAGIKLVESKHDQPRPTPAQALEPAFEGDKIPPKPSVPAAPAPVAQPQPQPQPPSPQQPSAVQDRPQSEITDDLDMTPAPAAPAAQPPAPWRDHVIKGVKRFSGRKIGDLDKKELRAVEEQWIPRVRELWDQTNQDQREDYTAFEAAIAFFKMESQKPW